MAVQKGLQPLELLQMFLFERLLERLAASPYRQNFILKGGLLISFMIGIEERTTMDMDTTVSGLPMEEETIAKIVEQIVQTDIGDGICFSFKRIEPIREEDAYHNFRVHLEACSGKIRAPMKIDITTGDRIVPAAIGYQIACMFEEKSISVMAYPLETVIAEKFETVIRRGIANTRARDFYDLYMLFRGRHDEIRRPVLR